MIRFGTMYEEDIVSGKKRITIRKGIVNDLFPGQIENTNIGVQLRIKSIRYCYFESLVESELKDDNFLTLVDCMEVLERFYGTLTKYDLCTVIRFEKVK